MVIGTGYKRHNCIESGTNKTVCRNQANVKSCRYYKSGSSFFYPNPAGTYINAVLPESIRGAVNIRIYNLAGIKVSDFDTEASDRYPVRLDVSRLPAGSYFAVFTGIPANLSYTGRFIISR